MPSVISTVYILFYRYIFPSDSFAHKVVYFLRLRVTRNALQLPFYFFSFSFSSVLLDGRSKVFLRTSYHALPRKRVTKIGPISLDTQKNA